MNHSLITSKLKPIGESPFWAATTEMERFRRHFGFHESPFGVTSDPAFLFWSDMHKLALQEIIRSIEANLGFSLLLGEPGTGKSTLLVQLLSHYRDRARTAFIFHTQCDPHDFLRYIASDFGLLGDMHDQVSLHHELQDLLIQEARAGRKALIIVDEAQNLGAPCLEAVRLLSNFETGSSKLLNVVLAGQSRLAETLGTPELSQLTQRIATICRLQPLTPEEVRDYVRCRVAIATNRSAERIFSPESLAQVASYSKGVPRLINAICNRALLLAYNQDQRSVSGELVKEAEVDLDLRGPQHVNADQTEAMCRAKRGFASTRLKQPPSASSNTSSRHLQSEEASCQRILENCSAARTPHISREHGIRMLPKAPGGHRDHLLHLTMLLATLALVGAGSWLGWNEIRARPIKLQGYANQEPKPQEADLTPSTSQSLEMNTGTGQSAVHQYADFTEPLTNSKPQHEARNQAPEFVDLSPASALPSKIHSQSFSPVDPVIPSDVIHDVTGSDNLKLPIAEEHPSVPRLEEHPLGNSSPAGALSPRPLKVIQPEYPAKAKLWHIEGKVHLELTIDTNGKVGNVRVLSGNPVLAQAAVRAVQRWQYSPIESHDSGPALTWVQFNFKLNSDAANK